MANHGSAIEREETPQSTQTPHVNKTTRTATIIEALKRRAESVLNDRSIDPQSRAVLRYAFETNDPWLARMVRRAEASEPVIAELKTSRIERTKRTQTPQSGFDFSSETKIDILAEIICRPGDDAVTKSAALLVLMATLENSSESNALANRAKHFAFVRCTELNLDCVMDMQVAMLDTELFAVESSIV